MSQQHSGNRRLRSGIQARPPFAQLLGMTTILACVGCGEDWQAETYPAGGQITINGEPAAGAVVELHSIGEQPDERNSRPWAIVQEGGSYTLSTYEKGDGAPVGEYAATVRWPPETSQPTLADRLSGKYSKPAGSEWNFVITEGDNELPPIEITGVKVLSKEQASGSGKAPPGPGMGN